MFDLVSEQPAYDRSLIDAMLSSCRRATLPYQQAHRGDLFGTAFWFNDLLSEDANGTATYDQYLVTAGASTLCSIAEIRMRPELSESALSANGLLMTDFQQGWIPLGDSGVSVLPATALHALARRKGWAWATDEITEGLAAKAEDIEALGDAPVSAYVLGHDVGPDRTQREQAVILGEVMRSGDGHGFVWRGPVPQGCVGAPVFVGIGLEGRNVKLVCLGVLLSREGEGERALNPVATFDRIRTDMRRLPEQEAPAPEAYSAPPPRSRWWRRRV